MKRIILRLGVRLGILFATALIAVKLIYGGSESKPSRDAVCKIGGSGRVLGR